MNVELLIQDAYRFAEILAEAGENADADQLDIGLRLLNMIIREINLDGEEKPLLDEEEFTLAIGVEILTMPNWVEPLKIQYLLGSVWFDITLTDLNAYLDNSRIENTSGIPFTAYAQRTPTGIDLRMFFKPSANYVLRAYGYKNLSELTVSQELTGILDFLKDYLLYRLASDFRTYYQLPRTPFLTSKVLKFENKLFRIKERRFDIHKITLGGNRRGASNMAALNLGQGWRPY